MSDQLTITIMFFIFLPIGSTVLVFLDRRSTRSSIIKATDQEKFNQLISILDELSDGGREDVLSYARYVTTGKATFILRLAWAYDTIGAYAFSIGTMFILVYIYASMPETINQVVNVNFEYIFGMVIAIVIVCEIMVAVFSSVFEALRTNDLKRRRHA